MFIKKIMRKLVSRLNCHLLHDKSLPNIKMPKSFRGFYYMSEFPFYDRIIPRIITYLKNFNSENIKNISMIDVGANIGDTVALVRQYHDIPILAVEGDDEYFSYLEVNSSLYTNITITKQFLGEKDENIGLKLTQDMGSARLQTSSKKISIISLDTLLEQYENFKKSCFLKIDTDGYDSIIIRGAKKYISGSKPIIFMEYDPQLLAEHNDNGIDIFNELFEMGYTRGIVYENFGVYMFSFRLNDLEFIYELKNYFFKNKLISYADILLFHDENQTFFNKTRDAELRFFENYKL